MMTRTDLSIQPDILKTERLQRLASLVPPCECMVDVGTDHGWLPIALVKAQVAQRAIASDVLPDPLKSAHKHVRMHNLLEVVDVRLGHGLSTVKPNEVEVATIAGMGLKSILSILHDNPPDTLGIKTLIIQTPQVDNTLRAHFINELQWHVSHEEIILESQKLYHMLVVHPQQKPDAPHAPTSALDQMISKTLQESQSKEALIALSDWLAFRHNLRINGMKRASSPDEDALKEAILQHQALVDFKEKLQGNQD